MSGLMLKAVVLMVLMMGVVHADNEDGVEPVNEDVVEPVEEFDPEYDAEQEQLLKEQREFVLDMINDLKGSDPFFEFCVGEPQVGACSGIYPRYAFSISDGECIEFNWGGCHHPYVTLNNFETETACLETCMYGPQKRASKYRLEEAQMDLEFEQQQRELAKQEEYYQQQARMKEDEAAVGADAHAPLDATEESFLFDEQLE